MPGPGVSTAAVSLAADGDLRGAARAADNAGPAILLEKNDSTTPILLINLHNPVVPVLERALRGEVLPGTRRQIRSEGQAVQSPTSIKTMIIDLRSEQDPQFALDPPRLVPRCKISIEQILRGPRLADCDRVADADGSERAEPNRIGSDTYPLARRKCRKHEQ